ncbi:hypothetical protein PSSHI_04910 [Photobacterium sp. R1]
MTAMSVILFFIFLLGMLALISLCALSVYLGFMMKETDPGRYKAIYTCHIPTSVFLLFDYVNTADALVKYPLNKRWVFHCVKLLILTILIAFLLIMLSVFIIPK